MSSSQRKFLATPSVLLSGRCIAILAGTAILTASLVGCAGNGSGLDANGIPIGAGSSGGGTEPLTADFDSIQDNIFTPICSPCHSGASAPQGLMLDAGHSYNLLVGVPSNEVPSVDRVKPGDPDHSYIILKLQGSAGIVGSRMPLNQTPLPQSTIDVIRQWITNGAQPGAAAPASAANTMQKIQELGNSASAGSFAVAETEPTNAAVADAPLARIVVAFNHEVDASLVNYTTLTLERIRLEEAAQAVRVPSYATLAEGNSNVIIITPAAALVPGTYRVTVRGTGGGALADMNARTLGSDYSFTFNVDGSP